MGLQDIGPGFSVSAVNLDELLRRLANGQRTPRVVFRAVGHLFRIADLLQLRANAAIEDDHPTGPQSLVNAAISRSHGASGRLHGTSLLDGDPLFKPDARILERPWYQACVPAGREHLRVFGDGFPGFADEGNTA